MNTRQFKLISFFTLILALTFSACKKDKDDPTDPGSQDRVLVIENGASSIKADETPTYSARYVNEDGTTSPADGVSWSSSESGIASISASGVLTTAGVGTTTITATVTDGDQTLTASVPLGVVASTIFAVAPSAIIWETSGGPIQLETVYFGTTSPTYTYASSNASVASVSSSGLVSFNSTGEAVISVTSSAAPSQPFLVPVLVVGLPSIALPVSRIEVDPASADIFRGDSRQFTATAYNTSGTVSETFTWASSDPAIASVDNNGKITGHAIGTAYIRASAKGITGQAEVIVNPDTVVIVTPFIANIPAGGTKQFSATAYDARNGMTVLSGVSNFDWLIPTYGFPVFDVATVNSSGLVTVKSGALPGNATFLVANVSGSEESVGAALIMVSICDCGNGNPSVASIAGGGNLSLSLFNNPTAIVNATATDVNGDPVANPDLRYCTDNTAVVNVDEITGEVFAMGPGTASVSICSGGYAETSIQVDVSL